MQVIPDRMQGVYATIYGGFATKLFLIFSEFYGMVTNSYIYTYK